MSRERKKPVKLQANTSGAWKDVVRFDADNTRAAAEVMDAAETLGRVSAGDTTFRVVIDDGLGMVLYRWEIDHGWKEVSHAD